MSSPAPSPHAGHQPDLRAIFYTVRERAWIVALCLLLAALGTAAYLYRAPKIFAAKTVLQVEQEEQKILNIEQVQKEHLQSLDFLKTVEQTLKSRTLLERVLTNYHLAEHPRFAPPTTDGPRSNEQLITLLADMVDVRLRKGTRLIDVQAEHPVPAFTELIANALVREYMRQSVEHNASASDTATEFLQTEAVRLKARLDQSEAALQTYQEQSQSASLEGRQSVIKENLRDLSSKVTDAKSARIIQESAHEQIREMGTNLAGLLVIPAVANDPRVLEIRSQVAKQESEIANLSQRYRARHPKYIQAQSQLAEWKSALAIAIFNVTQTVRLAYQNARTSEQALEQALREQETAALEMGKQTVRYNELARDVESDRALFQSVLNRIKETTVTKDIGSSKVRVVQRAAVPEKPIKPEKLKVALMGLIAGLGLGVLLVLLLDAMDRSLKTVDQAEEYLGLPVLTAIPRIAGVDQRRLIQSEDSRSGEAEAFRTLRTSLSMLGRKEDRRTFLFTSAVPSEGKTFCSLNFAASLAQQGLRTLIIDGDLRRPMVEKSLKGNSEKSFGVTDYLTGHKPFDAVVHPTPVENLFYLPAGTTTPNPAELLAKTGVDALIDEALLHYDRVIVDSAPIHAVSDTLLMLNRIQTVCLVLLSRRTAKNAVLRAVQMLREASAPLAGVIMNQMPRRRGVGYYYDSYYHYSYYGYDTDKKKPDRLAA
jgi:capsular exopolysaccharide synthesis family protein